MNVIYVAIAGAVGVLMRHGVNLAAASALPNGSHWGTLAVNTIGSFAIGVVTVLGFERFALSEGFRVAVSVGLLGGFTTFSSFSLEAVKMIETNQWLHAVAYTLLSVVLCLGATVLGMQVTR